MSPSCNHMKEVLDEANARITAQYQQIRAEHVFEGGPDCTLCGCFGPVEDDQPCVPRKDLVKQIHDLRTERDDLQTSADLRWKADMRAIKLWQETHPGSELVWPDHADLCVWLMEELDRAFQRGMERAAEIGLNLSILPLPEQRMVTVIQADRLKVAEAIRAEVTKLIAEKEPRS